MPIIVTLPAILVLLLGVVVAIREAGYGFDLRRQNKRVAARRESDLHVAR